MSLRKNWRLLLLFALLATTACGQKGALYLPGDESELQPVLPDELAATDEQEESDATDPSADESQP